MTVLSQIRPTEPDDALMERVRDNDTAALAELQARWGPRTHRFLHRRCGDAALAAEAHHLTWARVWSRRARHAPDTRFEAWLFEQASRAGSDAPTPTPDGFGWVDGTGEGGARDRDRLVCALHALEPVDRRAVLLFAEGFSPAEVEAALGLDPDTAQARIRMLRPRLLPPSADEDPADPLILVRWISRLRSPEPPPPQPLDRDRAAADRGERQWPPPGFIAPEVPEPQAASPLPWVVGAVVLVAGILGLVALAS